MPRAVAHFNIRLICVLLVSLIISSCVIHTQPSNQQIEQIDQDEDSSESSPKIDDDEFMLLEEGDIVQQDNVLKYLETASKEEVEEILQQSPELQQKLLSRVRKVVRTKDPRGPPMIPINQPLPPPDPSITNMQPPRQPISRPDSPVVGNDYEYEYFDDSDDLGVDKAALIRSKLKDRASKLVKIGKGLKSKLKAMRLSKKLKGSKEKVNKKGSTLVHKDYHLHFDVSKTSDKIS